MTHGLRTTYAHRGCRCPSCTKANRDYKRLLRARSGKPPVSRPIETSPVEVCAICRTPLAAHNPYFRHQVSAPVMLFGEVEQPGSKIIKEETC